MNNFCKIGKSKDFQLFIIIKFILIISSEPQDIEFDLMINFYCTREQNYGKAQFQQSMKDYISFTPQEINLIFKGLSDLRQKIQSIQVVETVEMPVVTSPVVCSTNTDRFLVGSTPTTTSTATIIQ